MYGRSIGGNVALGYVRNEAGATPEWVNEGEYEIACRRYKVEAGLRAFYDPQMTRIRC